MMALPGYFLEDPLDDAGADTEFLADLEDTVARVPQLQYSGFHRRLDPAAS
jgi:hypothetical protein